jgi:translation initiation factor eIF-2B subunit delta
MNKIYEEIESLRNDRSHGASELTRQALKIMQDAARSINAANQLEFLEFMRSIAEELIKARTTMVSIRNAISGFMYQLIMESSRTVNNLETIQACSIEIAADLINKMSKARVNTIQNAAKVIADGTRLIICSYSSTVNSVLEQASASGKSFELMILESKYGDYKYGEMTAALLNKKGITNKVFADEQITYALSQSDMVLTGADAVLANGSVINGYPSLSLAIAAAENVPPVPVYSICESIKFYPGNTIFPEEGFDLIPAQLIKGIITENTALGLSQ